MITEIDFKVTGEERKKLAYAIGETLGLLTLNNVKLEVGKMIYAKKDGKWICTSIVSIQLNDKDVDQVDNGEVGIVTDIELEKGYEIFVKIE